MNAICECGNHCWKPINKGFVLLVSVEDAGLLDLPWRAARDHKGYVAIRRSVRANGRRRQERLARVIVEPRHAHIADHKNRNTLDNRRENLREATFAQNAQNRSNRRDNTSGRKGVFPYKVPGKWRAQIKVRGKYKFLGVFPTKEEAAEAYAAAAKRHYGEFYADGVA